LLINSRTGKCVSLIKQLFHPHKLAARFIKFWINTLKHRVLTDDQINWIVKRKIEGKLENEEIRYLWDFYKESIADIFFIQEDTRRMEVCQS